MSHLTAGEHTIRDYVDAHVHEYPRYTLEDHKRALEMAVDALARLRDAVTVDDEPYAGT
jgi:hypothetical protein